MYRNSKKVDHIHVLINERMDQLIEVTRTQARLQGVQDEREEVAAKAVRVKSGGV